MYAMRKKRRKNVSVSHHHQRTMIVPIIPAAKQRQEIENNSGMGCRCRYLHWALKHLFSACRFSWREKRGSRSRCVIKCNLNWMAKAGRRMESILSDGYLGQMLTLLKQHQPSEFHTHNMLTCPFVYASKWWLNFRKTRSERRERMGKQTTWNV